MAFEKAMTAPIQKRQKRPKLLFTASAVTLGVYGVAMLVIGIIMSSTYVKLPYGSTGVIEMSAAGLALVLFSIISVLGISAQLISFKWYIPLAACIASLSFYMSVAKFLAIPNARHAFQDLSSGHNTGKIAAAIKFHLLEAASIGVCYVDNCNRISCTEKSMDEYFRVLTCDGTVPLSGQCHEAQKEEDIQDTSRVSAIAVVVCTASQKVADRLVNMLYVAGTTLLVAGGCIILHTAFAVWLNFSSTRAFKITLPK